MIDATIEAIRRQTYPIAEILLIDNASIDDTLGRNFPDKVTIIRNDQNRGISGAIAAAMEYALAHGYEWIYILDADSRPEPQAIERLVSCYAKLNPELRARTWRLSSLAKDAETGFLHHGCVFTRRGVKPLNPPSEPSHYRCDAVVWSGSFYRLDAVKTIGLPNPNYVIDWDDMIYGYEGMVRGYTGFIEQSSVLIHHMHVFETMRLCSVGTRPVKVFDSPPRRWYYFWRNSTYFWIYRYRRANRAMPMITHCMLFCRWQIKIVLFVKAPRPILSACLRGMRDGILGRLGSRY